MPRPPLPSNIVCFHCQSKETSKAGFARGKQRYYCRACRRWFRENPVIPEGTKKHLRWRPKSLPAKSNLILELLAIAQALGRTPTTNDINEFSKVGRAHSLNIYYDVFDSFLEAIKKSKLKPRYKQEFNKEKLLAELRDLQAKLKRPLLGKDVITARKKGKVSSIYHFQRAFGTIPKAIEAAGVGKKTYSRAEMIEVLRKIDAKLDRPVSVSDIKELFRTGESPSHRAIEREFGGMVRHAAPPEKKLPEDSFQKVIRMKKYSAAKSNQFSFPNLYEDKFPIILLTKKISVYFVFRISQFDRRKKTS